MNIEFFKEVAKRRHFNITSNNNSNAVHVPENMNSMTVLVSSISGGAVTIQYSLSDQHMVENDSAVWHDWSLGEVTSTSGLPFDSPIAYIRVISTGAQYTLELLL